MKSGKGWRTGLLVVLVTGLLAASERKGVPRVTVQSPSGLYLLAQYKLAVGDTRSALELLDRALARRDDALVSQAFTRCKPRPAIATP
ncbi:MAG TPA: hypothetical protein VE734_09680 [Terriglobales bacterium]|nr:hypothetical protein [Terriglobales bacterium]